MGAASRAGRAGGGERRPGGAGRPGRYWLVKSEPAEFSFDDLLDAPARTTGWHGVRNYQARNLMRDEMQVGDLVLFYHSNAAPPGVAGLAEVSRAAYPDPTALDPADPRHDPRSRADAPTWMTVDLRAVERFPVFVPLEVLRATPALAGMELLRRGSRLSVQPVREPEFTAVCALGRAGGRAASPPRAGR